MAESTAAWKCCASARPDGRLVAVMFRHSCHGTVRGHDSLEISGDWPGAAARRIEAETGAVAPFLLGAHADVDPRTRGLMDLAIPGQSIGLGAEAVRVLGGEVADAVLASLSSAHPGAGRTAARRAHRAREAAGSTWASSRRTQLARELARRKTEVAAELGLAVSELPRLSSSTTARMTRRAACRWRPRASASRACAPICATAPRPSSRTTGASSRSRCSSWQSAGRSCSPCHSSRPRPVGQDWRARVAARGLGLVVGIGNGWCRYLPHASDLAHPLRAPALRGAAEPARARRMPRHSSPRVIPGPRAGYTPSEGRPERGGKRRSRAASRRRANVK